MTKDDDYNNGAGDSGDGDGRRRPSRDGSSGELIEGIYKLLEKLTNSQISNVEDKIINYCVKYIVPFKENNVRNFLGSVESCCSRFHSNAQICIVLDYAKTRVTADPVITTKNYVSFDEFKFDILSRFKPQKDVLQTNQAIALLHQGFDETVSQYGTRVLELKNQYEEAVFSKYAEDSVELSSRRLEESEDLCVRYFILGLKSQIRSFMQGVPKNLRLAINEAETGEANLEVQTLRKNMSQIRSEKGCSGHKNGNDSRKFRKDVWHDRNNYNRDNREREFEDNFSEISSNDERDSFDNENVKKIKKQCYLFLL